MQHALVTGASGFIGAHLVRRLREAGDRVTCLVRPSSDRSRLQVHQPEFVVGDVTDRDSVKRAVASVDVVYHLAGVTKALSKRDLQRVNVDGVRHVTQACADCANPPTLILVSSLAAAGPTKTNRLRTESDAESPVSIYGCSKLAGEREARRFSGHIPLTIIRPPIVFGEADRDGLNMFGSIARWNLHFTAGLWDKLFSVIHGDDLAAALRLAAERGKRVQANERADGIYFATSGETPSYAELGVMIGEAVGRRHVAVFRTPELAVWMIAAFNELFSQVRRRPHILGIDKAREATAGSWACDGLALQKATGFKPSHSLRQRLVQTAQWYRKQGWLPSIAHEAPAPSEGKTYGAPTMHSSNANTTVKCPIGRTARS